MEHLNLTGSFCSYRLPGLVNAHHNRVDVWLHDYFQSFVQGIGVDLCQSSGNNKRLNEADKAIDSLPLLLILCLSLERSLWIKNVITVSPLFTLYSRKMISFSWKIVVFSVCRVILRTSVINANNLPNQNTEFDKRSVSKQKRKRAKRCNFSTLFSLFRWFGDQCFAAGRWISHLVKFHMTSLKFKLKNYSSYLDFTFRCIRAAEI